MIKYILIGVGVIGIAFFAIPALKGPVNRYKLQANEALNAEYVVDNYKAEYVKMNANRGKVAESLLKFRTEKKVAEKKLAYAAQKREAAKAVLKQTGTADMQAFARAKDAYELANAEVSNFEAMVNTYVQGVKKLETSLDLITANMAKAKHNVDTLTAKKETLDAIKVVNKTIENISGVGDTDLAVSVEKLDDDTLRESIKLEALNETNSQTSAPMTEAEAKAYIDSLK